MSKALRVLALSTLRPAVASHREMSHKFEPEQDVVQKIDATEESRSSRLRVEDRYGFGLGFYFLTTLNTKIAARMARATTCPTQRLEQM